jgi:hypothetical protein
LLPGFFLVVFETTTDEIFFSSCSSAVFKCLRTCTYCCTVLRAHR